jgi:hypothetical protein
VQDQRIQTLHEMFGANLRTRRSIIAMGGGALLATGLSSFLGAGPAEADVLAGTGNQPDWRFCDKCFGMFYSHPNAANGFPGKCPATGAHHAQGFVFTLHYDSNKVQPVAGRDSQYDWRFCGKCFSMFWDGAADKGHCAGSGGHASFGFMFGLPHDNPANAGQPDWRFCGKCRVLFFDDPHNANKGKCPADGQGHIRSGNSFNFELPFQATAQDSLAAILVREGQKLLGVCVKTNLSTQPQACAVPPNPPGIGDGECTQFVQLAAKNAGARAPVFDNNLKDRNYNWGTKITSSNLVSDIQVGDILQFWEANFKGPNAQFGTGNSSDPVNNPNHHTAIVASKSGNMVTLLEQNWANVRLVQQHTYDYSLPHTGDVFIYRVVKA